MLPWKQLAKRLWKDCMHSSRLSNQFYDSLETTKAFLEDMQLAYSRLVVQNEFLNANMASTSARCTSLLEEVRALRAENAAKETQLQLTVALAESRIT